MRCFTHVSSSADLQVEVVQLGAGAQVHVSPRVSPAGALQWRRRVLRGFTGSAAMKRPEPQYHKGAHVQTANNFTHLLQTNVGNQSKTKVSEGVRKAACSAVCKPKGWLFKRIHAPLLVSRFDATLAPMHEKRKDGVLLGFSVFE